MLFEDYFLAQKRQWQKRDSFRSLRVPQGIDFCSNDYLSFSENKDLKERIYRKAQELPIGSTGSRLLRGHSDHIEQLEQQLAKASGQQASLFFPTGFQANLALMSCLLGTESRVFSDAMIHASLIDGMRLARSEKYIWNHNNLDELESLLKVKAKPDKMNFIVVESLYSMKGDFSPLSELTEICERYNALLIVDEAHATGLYGKGRSGMIEKLNLMDKVFASVHTGGKALGVSGAWIACSHDLKTLMVNSSRPFIYTTAPSFYQQVAMGESVKMAQELPEQTLISFFRRSKSFQKFLLHLSSEYGFGVLGGEGPITAIVLGENLKTLQMMERLAENNCDVRAIRPPTVPEGEALLRITLPLNRSESEFSHLKSMLKTSLKDLL